MNAFGKAEPTGQPGKVIRFDLLIGLAIRPAFFLRLIQCLPRGAELLLMGIVLLIKLSQHLARLHHGSADQAILAAELFCFLSLEVRLATISKVFGVPSLIGTLLTSIYYVMILYFNDNQITQSEIIAVMIERMMACIRTLPLEERSLVRELFFYNKGERQLSAETGIPQMTLHYRKSKILKKLRKLLEK